MASPIRVLYVESGRGAVGGSVISLLTLVRHLDRALYRPHLLLFDDVLARPEFEALDCSVTLWSDVHVLDEDAGASAVAIASRRVTAAMSLGQPYLVAAGVYRLLSNDFPLALRFCRLVAELGVDLVHANDRVRSNTFAIYGARLAGCPVVVHERWLSEYTWCDRLASRFVSAICCVSRAVRDSAARQGAGPAEMVVLHNPVEIPAEVARPSSPPMISFVGRLVAWKGVDVFIEACGILGRQRPELKFTVVGGDPTPGEPFAKTLHRRAMELGLRGRIRFTGATSNPDAVLHRSTVLVHASVEPEPFGRTVIEGMAHGLPVVATALGGPKEIIESGKTGILVEPGNSQAIVDAVVGLLDDPDKIRKISIAARESAIRRFMPESHAASIMAMYRRVLERTPRSGR